MTQIFNEQGQQIPCTVIEAEPNPVRAGHATGQGRLSRRCSSATARSASRASRRRASARRAAVARQGRVGHAKKAGLDGAAARAARVPARRRARRGRDPDVQRRRRGQGRHLRRRRTVKVTGTSKGRGFQGVVKRYGFGGGPNTHGNTKHRSPGSIGPGTDPSRVIKGKKMPGHYGDARHTQTQSPRREDRRRAQPDLHPRRRRRSDRTASSLVRKQG